jgi:hypothetical protein
MMLTTMIVDDGAALFHLEGMGKGGGTCDSIVVLIAHYQIKLLVFSFEA